MAVAPEQLLLLPTQRPTLGKIEDVPLDRLPPDESLPSPEPGRDLVESIRRWGVLDPILVRAAGGTLRYDDPQTFVAGRRRLKAVRLLREAARADVARLVATAPPDTLLNDETVPGYGAAYETLKEWTRIPVRALSDPEGTPDDPSGPVLTLASNAVRQANPVTDLAMLERLLARATKQELGERQALTEIGRATGLSVQTIKQRLRLRSLTPSLRRLFDTNRLSYTVALEASRLPAPAQDRLLAALKDGQALTTEDVKAARKGDVEAVRQRSLGDVFPQAEWAPPSADLARPLRQRGHVMIAQLRETRLPICVEAASLLAEALAEVQLAQEAQR